MHHLPGAIGALSQFSAPHCLYLFLNSPLVFCPCHWSPSDDQHTDHRHDTPPGASHATRIRPIRLDCWAPADVVYRTTGHHAPLLPRPVFLTCTPFGWVRPICASQRHENPSVLGTIDMDVENGILSPSGLKSCGRLMQSRLTRGWLEAK